MITLASFVAMGATALPLIEALLKEMPHLVDDVKAIVAAVEGKSAASGSAADEGPLAPRIVTETQPLVDALKGK